jgi:hypothetical protein
MARITERSAQQIIAEFEEDGYLAHEKVGRRNHSMLSTAATLRHPRGQPVEIGFLVDVFRSADGDPTSTSPA